MPVPAPPTIPHGRTARRLEWRFLPPEVRRLVEARLGSPVVRAESQGSGFTPGFASVLTGEDGAQLFVKAANRKAQPQFAAAYAQEVAVLRALGSGIPSPRLEFAELGDWVVLGFEAIRGSTPRRPWRADELGRCLDLAEEVAASTTTAPSLALSPLHEDLPRLVTGWDHIASAHPDWPHLAEAAALARSFAELPADRFVHADLRDDNILIGQDGRTLACDWNWPALAPAWIDLVVLLVSAHAEGHPADDLLAGRALTADVPEEHIDAWLAAFCGFMAESADQPVPPTSPYLRDHARWYAAASWAWLAERRGW